MASAPAWLPKEPDKDKAAAWNDFRTKGMASGSRYALKRNWGGKFATETKKFEFYSATLKKGLAEHAKKHESSIDDVMAAMGYVARGELVFVPHYEPPKRHGSAQEFPFDFVDYKSRLNREGRSANVPWYQEFKKVDPGDVSWDDVVKMNPADGKRLGLKTGDMVKVTSTNGSMVTRLKLWEGVRPGAVAKCYGQGHWAYGRVASKEFGKVPRGGNNNDVLVDDYDRLSGLDGAQRRLHGRARREGLTPTTSEGASNGKTWNGDRPRPLRRMRSLRFRLQGREQHARPGRRPELQLGRLRDAHRGDVSRRHALGDAGAVQPLHRCAVRGGLPDGPEGDVQDAGRRHDARQRALHRLPHVPERLPVQHRRSSARRASRGRNTASSATTRRTGARSRAGPTRPP